MKTDTNHSAENAADRNADQSGRFFRGVLITALGGICWGSNGTLIQYLYSRYEISGSTLTCVRAVFGGLLLLLLGTLKGDPGVAGVLRDREHRVVLFLYATFGLAFTQFAYTASIRASNAGTATVKVTGKGNYSGTKTLTFTIKSNTNKETKDNDKETKGNELIFHIDCWNFENPATLKTKLTSDQMKQLKDACYNSEEYFEAFKDYWNNKEKGRKFDDEGNVVLTGGICYGMSCITILNKMRQPLFSSNLNKESKNDYASVLAFYQVSQRLPAELKAEAKYCSKTGAERIKELEKKAAAVKKGGAPVLLTFGADGWGNHAVVAYAVESGSFKGAHGDLYDHRILTYDCNDVNFINKVPQFTNDRCLLYNHGSDKWEIPHYYDKGVHSGKGYIKDCVTDIKILNPNASSHKGKISGILTVIWLYQNKEVKMQSEDWKASGSNMGLTSKTKGTVSFYDSDVAVGTKNLILNVIPPKNLSTINVSTKNGSAGDLDVQCLMKGAYHNISCDRAKSITANNDGTFTIHGNNGNFDIRTTVSNGTTYRITGTSKNSGDIKVVKKDKLVATGNKAVGVKITVTKSSNSKKSQSFVVTSTKGDTADVRSKSLKKGSVFTAGKAKYKVTKAGVSGLAEVQFKAPGSKKYSSVTIPNTVKYKGITYKVTSIADKAFQKNKKLKKVTIGVNVTKIGKAAFYRAKKLKKIVLKTQKLNTIGSKAFKKIHKKAVFYIPKSVRKVYKVKLLKAGASKKCKFK